MDPNPNRFHKQFRLLINTLKNAKISRKLISDVMKHKGHKRYSQATLSNLYTEDSAPEREYEIKIQEIESEFSEYIKKVDDQYKVTKIYEGDKKIDSFQIELLKRFDIQYFVDNELSKSKTLKLIDTWLAMNDHTLLEALKNDKIEKIQILILDPLCSVLKCRLDSMRKKGEIINIDQILAFLDRIVKLYPSKLEIRIYKELPGVNCYILEEKIFYGNYLSFDYSQNTYFHNTINHEDNFIARQINQHFDEIWNHRSQLLTLLLLEKMKDQLAILNISSEAFKKFSGTYLIYNLDEDKETPFQVSVIKFNGKDEDCELIYKDRNSDKDVTIPGSISFLDDNNHLLLVFKKDNFLLHILGYYTNKNVFQAVYLHTDRDGRPRSSLCILKKENNKEHALPSRSPDKIPDNIRWYLTEKNKMPAHIDNFFNSIQEVKPNYSNNYRLAELYEGEWDMHYNIKFPLNEELKGNDFVSEIARSKFIINKKINSGVITCEFRAHDGSFFEGEPLSDLHLKNSKDILGFIVHNRDINSSINNFDRAITFFFYVGNKRRDSLLGTYNITYSNGIIGCGLTMLKRSNTEIKLPIDRINPFDMKDKRDLDIKQNLSFKNTQLSTDDFEDVDRDTLSQYVGLYNIYNYGSKIERGKEGKKIIKTVMEITDFGLVRFKGLKSSSAYGTAYLLTGDNLFIEMVGENDRDGYFILNVGNFKPNEDTIYTGVFAGLTVKSRLPIAKRIIAQHIKRGAFEEMEVEEFGIFEENLVANEIRRSLTGNFKNVVGFLKRGKAIFSKEDLKDEINSTTQLANALFKGACYCVLEENTSDATKIETSLYLLQKAIYHGFKDIELYLETLRQINPHLEAIISKDNRVTEMKNL